MVLWTYFMKPPAQLSKSMDKESNNTMVNIWLETTSPVIFKTSEIEDSLAENS